MTNAPHVKPDAKKVQEILDREHARIAEADARMAAMKTRNRERIARGFESPDYPEHQRPNAGSENERFFQRVSTRNPQTSAG